MAEPAKTKPTDVSVEAFLNSVEDQSKRQDAFALVELMQQITGDEPKMWGPSIIGFGNHHYKYDTGREGDTFRAGFSPRKQNIALYLKSGFDGYEELRDRLGKIKTGKSCIYVNRLNDIDLDVLRELVHQSSEHADTTTHNP